MDLTTVLGLGLCVVVIVLGALTGGPLYYFWNVPSVFITVCGSLMAMIACYPSRLLSNTLKITSKAIFKEPRDPQALLNMLQDMSNRARREGTLALEEFIDQLDDEFFARGVQLVVDGHEPQAVEDILFMEIEKIQERHKQGVDLFDTFALMAPAMGMIGTLIGLVHMLQNLDDPTKIGPGMATALLTTLYGSFIANVLATPIAKKLKARSDEEVAEKELIANGILSILNRESPRFLVERLNVQLAPQDRMEQVI
jgi:chemotaxis protein MotA